MSPVLKTGNQVYFQLILNKITKMYNRDLINLYKNGFRISTVKNKQKKEILINCKIGKIKLYFENFNNFGYFI